MAASPLVTQQDQLAALSANAPACPQDPCVLLSDRVWPGRTWNTSACSLRARQNSETESISPSGVAVASSAGSASPGRPLYTGTKGLSLGVDMAAGRGRGEGVRLRADHVLQMPHIANRTAATQCQPDATRQLLPKQHQDAADGALGMP